MLLPVQTSLPPVLPSAIVSEQRPHWLTVTDEQAAAARFITSEEFLCLPNPFSELRYRQIGFPFSLGRIQNTADICGSEIFQRVRRFEGIGQKAGFKERFFVRPYANDLPAKYAFLQDACDQFRIGDYCVYGQRNVLWHFEFEVSFLPAGFVQRPKMEESDADGYHIDGTFNDLAAFNSLRANLRAGTDPQNRCGVHRLFSTASIFPTDFPGKNFEEWDIIHFMAERHRSPFVGEDCVRFFMVGVAFPVNHKDLRLIHG